jgi:hypothetical protein
MRSKQRRETIGDPPPSVDGSRVGPSDEGGRGSKARTVAIGTAVAAYTLLDAYTIGILILVLATWANPLVVFLVAAVTLTPVNLAASSWVNRAWDAWTPHGGGLEERIDRLRSGRWSSHAVGWVTRSSVRWYMLAATLLNATVTVALTRSITGQAVDARRIRLGAMAYSTFFAAMFTLTGLSLKYVITAA